MSRIVYIDTETGGLDPKVHPLTQFAAIATEAGKELEHLEVKVAFDVYKADPEALKLNHWDPAVWAAEEVTPVVAVQKIGDFLRRHSTIEMRSAKGRPYKIARVGGYNVSFDIDFTLALFAGAFLPAHYRALDVLQLALWTYYRGTAPHPVDFHLQTMAQVLGVPVSAAHDALDDARTCWKVAEALLR